MFFNSIEFSIFLPIIFFLYWFITNKNLKIQNVLIIIASYIFYGWWDWRFLSLIIFSTLIDYSIGILLYKENNDRKRKLLLWISILVNIGFLGYFKYYNFFVDSFISTFSFFGANAGFSSINIILPVGISFYTFQTLSYTIDIYKRKLKPTNDIISFGAFVCFFPQLVAGPIERATHLLPQFYKKRHFDCKQAISGVNLIIWGLFKKMVIADNAALIVNGIFANYTNESSLSLLTGMLLFSFQIYCDFSGYSDIAIGVSRLFGFDLMNNFKFPYFSKNIREFWNRWHISLSTWFRDYLYIPLGGSRVKKQRGLLNIFIVFIVSGLWHGANWTFVFWGFLHALFFVPNFLFKDKIPTRNYHFNIKNLILILINFLLVSMAWIFFRAENISDAFQYLKNIFLFTDGQTFFKKTNSYLLMTINASIGILFLIIAEYRAMRKDKSEIKFSSATLIVIIILIFLLGVFKDQSNFIYFQF